jgi:serine/threonine-protein phosphatase 6 regulatory ankyrin repeat subunit B
LLLDALQAKLSPDDFVQHINKLSESGGSPIMFAAAGGHLDCTKRLYELGADPHAIARAVPEYLPKLEKMIADGTYNSDEPHIDGVTALHVAAQGGHLEVVDFLLQVPKVAVSVADDANRTPLLLAVKGSYGEVAIALVKAGADPNTPYVDDEGVEHNLLFDAIMVENEEFATLLITSGADLYYKDEKKVSTLLQASHRGLVPVVQALLEKHAANGKEGYIDDASDDGISPLIAASSEGHLEVVKLLLAAKAMVDAKDQDQTTALMAAAARGHVDVCKELVAAGASVNEQNADGHTALMFAYNGKNQVDTLWERYSQFVKEADEGMKKDMDDNGTGPIIRDALDKHIALIDLLLKSGADPALKDKEGHTAKDFDYNPDTDSEVLDKEAKAEKIRDESKYEL